jgi:hypothetical protein
MPSETTNLIGPVSETPLCMRQMSMIMVRMLLTCNQIVTFVDAVQFGIIFPFIYFMVKGFETTTDEKELGKYMFLLCNLVGFWLVHTV